MAVYKEPNANTWRVVYRYTDVQGNPKQTTKRGFATKREQGHSEWVCNACGHHSMSSSENNSHQKAHAMAGEASGWHVITVVDVPAQTHWERVFVPYGSQCPICHEVENP